MLMILILAPLTDEIRETLMIKYLQNSESTFLLLILHSADKMFYAFNAGIFYANIFYANISHSFLKVLYEY